MTVLRVAIAQTAPRLGAKAANLEAAEALVAQAARQGADLVLLPELWATGYAWEQVHVLADRLDEGAFAALHTWAARHNLAVGGSHFERGPEALHNTLALYGPDGLWGAYRKGHLFGPLDEPRYLAPGEQLGLCATPWGVLGLALCYDLRFPEMFRRLALEGARLVLISAAWPAERVHHWRTLLQARAIENQCFVVGVNRVGEDRGVRYGGHSMVCAPDGTVLAALEDAPGLTLATLDLDLVAATRRPFSPLRDRRLPLDDLISP